MKAFVTFTGFMMAVVAVAAQDTLPELVRRQKTAIETHVNAQRSPAIQLSDLASHSDVIARVLVLNGEVARLF